MMDSRVGIGAVHALLVDDMSSAWVQRGKVRESVDEIVLAHLELPPDLADPDDTQETWGSDDESRRNLKALMGMGARN